MATNDIAPGAYVRVVSGMYRGATGRVVSGDDGANGPYATVDVGEAQPITVYVSALELVGAVPTAEQERDAAIEELRRLLDERSHEAGLYARRMSEAQVARDAAIAERDRLRAEVADLLPEADAKQHFATRALRAEERLQRLRRELEALRDHVMEMSRLTGLGVLDDVASDIGDILRGES